MQRRQNIVTLMFLNAQGPAAHSYTPTLKIPPKHNSWPPLCDAKAPMTAFGQHSHESQYIRKWGGFQVYALVRIFRNNACPKPLGKSISVEILRCGGGGRNWQNKGHDVRF